MLFQNIKHFFRKKALDEGDSPKKWASKIILKERATKGLAKGNELFYRKFSVLFSRRNENKGSKDTRRNCNVRCNHMFDPMRKRPIRVKQTE